MSEPLRFPDGWIEQLSPLLGAELPDFLHSYEDTPARGVRMRSGYGPLPEAGAPIPWAEGGWYLPAFSPAGSAPAHEAGAYYLQEPSAMAAAAALRPAPGDKVLDLCAAPGGKSTQLAALQRGAGLIVCNEPVPSRAQILSRNLERMGVAHGVAVCALPEELSPRWPAFFDKILVDAPCSGEGMFRRHPEARREWAPSIPAGCAQRQLHILRHAAKMLRPGGYLAYSTCTFNALENEGVVEAFLKEHPAFALKPFSLPGLPSCGGMLRLWPHRVRGEGHFVALMENQEEAPSLQKGKKGKGAALSPPPREAREASTAFLREHIARPVEANAVFAGFLVRAPEGLPPLDGVRVLRLGLQLGQMRGRIFVPDHALALALPSQSAYPVTQQEARAYQSGLPLTGPETLRGWLVPALKGLQLGWAKASEGQIKNHYPKGLRRQTTDPL